MAAYKGLEFLEEGEGGEVRLSQSRKAKLDREVENLKEAEQYVLVALHPGWFPCYSCGVSSQIFLKKGEVWKYGVTLNGEIGRYGSGLAGKKLFYLPQFKGNLEECLIEERKKIYYYALLPENLTRKKPLPRPPGNKVDR